MGQTGAWRRELFALLVTLVVLCVLTIATEFGFVVLIATLLLYLAWHGFQIYKLYLWLYRGKTRYPPDAKGLWGDIFYMLFKVRKKSSRRQKEFLNIVSQFKASTSALPEGAVVLSENGELLWFNKSARHLLGLKAAKDIGQRAINLIRNPVFVNYIQAADFNDAIEICSPLNEQLILNIHITPYKQDQRLMMVRDVTRLHNLEQVRKDFIANASHELRSPLTVITGYLETITEPLSNKNPRYKKPLEDMLQQSLRMKSIVDDLLYLSKLENVSSGDAVEMVNVEGLMATIRKEAQALCDKKNQQLSVAVESAKQLKGSTKDLHSAFSNLVFNAIRYTPEGGKIEMSWLDLPKGKAAFCVKDTGIGIEAQHIPRLTERFYRVDKGRARDIGGTGLGLAIVKHVIEGHHGNLEISSELNKGSQFCCVFSRKILNT